LHDIRRTLYTLLQRLKRARGSPGIIATFQFGAGPFIGNKVLAFAAFQAFFVIRLLRRLPLVVPYVVSKSCRYFNMMSSLKFLQRRDPARHCCEFCW